MAIVVSERWSGPAFDYGTGGIRAKRIFDVTGVTTESDAIAAVVAFDPAYTSFNAPHRKSTWIYVDSQSGVPTGFQFWTVTIGYSSNPAGRHVDPGNPLLEPYRYHFEWSNITQGTPKDVWGNPIQNSAAEAWASEIPSEFVSGIMTVERNEPFYDAIGAVAYANAVNNADATFFALWTAYKGQACCRRIVPLTPITSASLYVTVQYVIELRSGFVKDSDGYWDGFKLRILDDGVNGWYDSGGGVKKRGPFVEVIGSDTQKVSYPIRLDGTGKPITAGAITGGSISSYGYFVGVPTPLSATGYNGITSPVAAPNPVPSTTVVETTADAKFLKVFPDGVKLKDLNSLGL